MIPPTQTSSPSHSASTSTSIAFSRKRSRKIARPSPFAPASRAQVVGQAVARVDDLHRPAAEDVGRAGRAAGSRPRRRARAPRRPSARSRRAAPRSPSRVQQVAEAAALLGQVDRVDARAEDREARLLEAVGELQRRLAAELHDDALRLLALADRDDVLERQRLEVEAVARVVVGRDGLGVAVDHHRVAARLADRHRRVDAAVVELDALPDPVRPAAEDDHARPVAALDLVGPPALPARVVVGRARLELGGAGVDGLERALAGERRLRVARPARRARRGTTGRCSSAPGSRSPRRRGAAPRAGRRSGPRTGARGGRAAPASVVVERRAARRARASASPCRTPAGRSARSPSPPPPTSCGSRDGVDALELLEREPRPLDDDVVDRRLERRGRRRGDVVVDLLERVADRQARRDLGDREPGRLRRQRATSATRAGSSR